MSGLLIRSSRRFEEIEGKHLALVIGTNLFVAVIPLMIVGFAVIEGFSSHETVGTVVVEAFHLTGSTAVTVDRTFASASAGRSVALSISVLSLVITGYDISETVQLAYARAFRMAPLRGLRKYLRGATWLVLLLITTGVSLSLRYLMASQPGVVAVLGVLGILALNFGFFLMTPRLLLDLPFSWGDLVRGALVSTAAAVVVHLVTDFELHQWFREYSEAYGAFGIGLALMAAVALTATFWVWIAAVMGVYWEGEVGAAAVERMERLSAHHG